MMINSKTKVRLFKCIGKDAILSTIQNGTAKLTRLGISNDPMEFRPRGHNYQLREWCEFIQPLRPLVLCLSSKYSSPPMWAHYADNHNGAAVAFEFDIQKSFKVPLPTELASESAYLYIHVISKSWYLLKCVYGKKRASIPITNEEVNKMRENNYEKLEVIKNDMCFLAFQMTALKGVEWSYENEYRLVYMLDPSELVVSGDSIVSCFRDNIRGILIGYKCKKEEVIKEKVKECRPDIWVEKMEVSPDKFEMICANLPGGTNELEEIEKGAKEIDVHEFVDKVLCDIPKPQGLRRDLHI